MRAAHLEVEQPRCYRLRRDLNELLFYRDGKVEPGKFWSNIGSAIIAYWLIAIPPYIWEHWMESLAIASALIAPDLARKIINARAEK